MELLQSQALLKRGHIPSESFDIDDAFGHGVFQKKRMMLGTIGVFLMSTHFAVIKVIAGEVDHWCQQPLNSNVSRIIWRKEFIPVEADGRPSSCRVYKNRTDFNNTEHTACHEWEYDVSIAVSTIVSIWNLVCHRPVLLLAALAAHNSGRMLTIVDGTIADYLGHAPVIRLAIGFLVIFRVASCFVTPYVTYIILRFLTTGFASVNCLMIVVSLFEIPTHDHRPLNIIFTGTIGFGLADLWFTIVTHIHLDWVLKQTVYLAPTVLSLATYVVVQESPRWLILHGNYRAAENVMFEGAHRNGYPVPNTACLLNRLREQVRDGNQECLSEQKKALEDCPLLRRQLIMTLSYFLLLFVFNVATLSQKPGQGTLFQWVLFSVVLLVYAVMHCLTVRVPLAKVLRFCYFIMGVIQSLLALAVYILPVIATELLLILSKACVAVVLVTSGAYLMELVPTAVRASALLVMFGGGSVGAVCASVFFVLQKVGREDVAFFLTAFLLFLSLVSLQCLPRATEVECAKIYTRRQSTIRTRALDNMKRTLGILKPASLAKKSARSTPRTRHTSPRPSPHTSVGSLQNELYRSGLTILCARLQTTTVVPSV